MDKLLLFLGVLCNVFAQLLLKHGMKLFSPARNGDSSLVNVVSAVMNPYVMGALVSYGAGFALYSLVISRMELSSAYPVASVTAILLLSVISMVFLHEAVSGIKIAGLSFCVVGILLVLS
jgi:multidrug transporter EmrE-like cation transporter